MIPHLTWWQRVIAWLLWKMEAKYGFGGGFDDELEGAKWMFDGHENHSYSMSLLRDYYYIKNAKAFETAVKDYERMK